MSSTPITDAVVNLLNELNKLDSSVLHCLISNRVQANSNLINHPFITVQNQMGIDSIGLLGILNGLVGPEGKVIMMNTMPNSLQGVPGKIIAFEAIDLQ